MKGIRRRHGRAKGGTYDVFRLSMGGQKRLVSGPHSWPVAWRAAAKLNAQARKDFAEGRHLYDVPEYVTEKRT